MAKSKFDRLLAAQLGFEDDDTVTTGDEEILSAAAQPESDIADMAPDAAEMEEASSAAEALTDSSAELEEVAEALSASAKAGGISTESAVYARLAIRGIVGRHSMALADAMVPSMESFGGSSSRQRATASMEGAIVEALKSFWNAIVAKMKKLFAYVKNWIMKVFGAAPKLKARAEALGKKAASVTGAAEEKSLDLNLMHQLHLKNKAPTPTEMVGELKTHGKLAEQVLGNRTSGSYEKVFEAYESDMATVDTFKPVKGESLQQFHAKAQGTAGIVATTMGLMDGFTITGGTTPGDAAARFGADVTITMSDETLGGKAIVKSKSTSTQAAGDFTLARFARSCWIRITDHATKPRDIDNEGSFKTLSSSEMRSLCDEVADICDHVITYKKSWEARDKQFAKMDTAAKKAITTAEKDKDDESGKARIVKDYALGISTMQRVGLNFETQYITYLLAVSRSGLTWVERSLSQYKTR
jgi:hypothetical protein